MNKKHLLNTVSHVAIMVGCGSVFARDAVATPPAPARIIYPEQPQ